MVGTSGSAKLGFSAPTPSARSLPERICAMDEGTEANTIWLLPATTSIIAGPAPRNGTCRRSTPAISLNSSGPRCRNVPTPDEAYFRSPGFSLASAISSLTDFTGRSALTDSRFGAVASMETGAKSFCES